MPVVMPMVARAVGGQRFNAEAGVSACINTMLVTPFSADRLCVANVVHPGSGTSAGGRLPPSAQAAGSDGRAWTGRIAQADLRPYRHVADNSPIKRTSVRAI